MTDPQRSKNILSLLVYAAICGAVIVLAVVNAPDQKETGMIGKWGIVLVYCIIGLVAAFSLLPMLGLRFPVHIHFKDTLLPQERTESWSLFLLAVLSLIFGFSAFLPPIAIPFVGVINLAMAGFLLVERRALQDERIERHSWYRSALFQGMSSQERHRCLFALWSSVIALTVAAQRLGVQLFTGQKLKPQELFLLLILLWVSLLGLLSGTVYLRNFRIGSRHPSSKIARVLHHIVESRFIGAESDGENRRPTVFSAVFGLSPFLLFYLVQRLPEGSEKEVIAAFGVYAGLYLGTIVYRIDRGEHDRLEQELKSAHDMQMGLMPKNDPEVPGFDISGICIPANEVGGDFFDYLWLDEGKSKLGIAVADVSGKAMKAAITAVMTSGMIYREVGGNESPKAILRKINKPIYAKLDSRMFTALSFAVIDTRKHELRFSNAGQAYPVLKQGGKVTALEIHGARLPLGVKKDVAYEEMVMKLKKGDGIVFHTDGIVEAKNENEDFYGFDRLRAFLEGLGALPAREMRDRILNGESFHRSRSAA